MKELPDSISGTSREGVSDGSANEGGHVVEWRNGRDERGRRVGHSLKHGKASIFKHGIVTIRLVLLDGERREEAKRELSSRREQGARRPQVEGSKQEKRGSINIALESEMEGSLFELGQLSVH